MDSFQSVPLQVNESSTIKFMTPEHARINALKQYKKHATQAIKTERDRQKIHHSNSKLPKRSIQRTKLQILRPLNLVKLSSTGCSP